MNRTLIILLASLIASATLADDLSTSERMGKKAVRGAIDLFTGIVELPMQTYKGFQNGCAPVKNEKTSTAVGTILGFFRGLGHTAGRMSHGGRELFCFWTADQPTNQGTGVPFDAQYSWQKGDPYSLFKPSFKEGTAPIVRKLTLGLANTFTGIVEVPHQIIKAKQSETSVGKGAGKGVYLFFSRTIYGATDVFTLFFLVPNQVDTYGYAYDSRYSWEKGSRTK